jgi:hypothetical protein
MFRLYDVLDRVIVHGTKHTKHVGSEALVTRRSWWETISFAGGSFRVGSASVNSKG